MLRCSVMRGKCSSRVLPVDQVAAGARPQRDPGDRRLALAGGAVAGARGQVDRGRRDGLGDRLVLLSVLAGRCLLAVVVDRVGIDVLLAAAERVDALGHDVDLEVRAWHRGLLAGRRLLLGLGLGIGRLLLQGLEGRVLGCPGDLLGLGGGNRVALGRRALRGRARAGSARRVAPAPPGRPRGLRPRRSRRSRSPPRSERRAGASRRRRSSRVCPRLPSNLDLDACGCCATCGCSGPA